MRSNVVAADNQNVVAAVWLNTRKWYALGFIVGAHRQRKRLRQQQLQSKFNHVQIQMRKSLPLVHYHAWQTVPSLNDYCMP